MMRSVSYTHLSGNRPQAAPGPITLSNRPQAAPAAHYKMCIRDSFRDTAADIRGIAKRRQLVRALGKSGQRQQFSVVRSGVQIHQITAGVVRALRKCFPGEAETHIVLAGEDPAGIFQDVRFVFPEPGPVSYTHLRRNRPGTF